MKHTINILGGALMALADSVPGVSGGTIAFIMGFYDEFIGSIDALITGSKEERIRALKFLIRLGIGWVIGFIPAVLVLSNVFESHIYVVSSLFIGFILFALPIIIQEERDTLRGKRWQLIFVLIGIAIVVLITYFNPTGQSDGIDTSAFSLGLGIYALITGAIAISAMVLPGISGSTLLLIFGLYLPIISGIKDLLHLHLHALPMLIFFGIGILIGFVSVVKIIKKCLICFRAQMIYLVIGLMLGSFYAIIMGPTTLDTPQPPLGFTTLSVGCVIAFVIGGGVILGLQRLKQVLATTEDK